MTGTAIEQAIADALAAFGAGEATFAVERPSAMEHGDYATNAALSAGKALKKNPRELAEALKRELEGELPGIEKIEVAGAGFLNFFLSRGAIAAQMQAAAGEAHWGNSAARAGTEVMVEYTDPNPFKEFHIGHLMSNAIGESVARLLEQAGAKVLRASYQGDVGPHVAKCLFGLRRLGIENPTVEDLGRAYVLGAARYEENEQDRAAIDALNKVIYEKSDPAVNELYAKGRAVSLEHFEELYRLLGTKFDLYFFESETSEPGLSLVRAHGEVFVESEGAVVFKGEAEGLHTRVFINKLGLPTYETKDLGLLALKQQQAASVTESVTVTANEQNEYFKVVLAAARHLPEVRSFAERTVHRSHGMMRFAQGKMSSRRGNVITGESLLADLRDASREKMQGRELADAARVAEQVAVAAVKFAILKQGSGKDMVFDPQKSLSLEGDSGPYVQYAHTRARSLIAAAEEAGIEPGTHDAPAHAGVLERTLLHFPDALARAARELEPHHVATYLTELAAAFNSWYAGQRVIGGAHPSYGLLLAQAAARTLSRGLEVLGIPAPEEM